VSDENFHALARVANGARVAHGSVVSALREDVEGVLDDIRTLRSDNSTLTADLAKYKSLHADLVEEFQGKETVIRNWEDLAEGYLDRAQAAESDRDSLKARLVEVEKERNAAIREADRLRHGAPIEGDFVCPDSLALTELKARLESVEVVYEASIAMRRSESRAALASDIIAEIEAERALTDAQVEARSQAALTRWRTVVDTAIAARKENGK
jgi:hypothetical protein